MNRNTIPIHKKLKNPHYLSEEEIEWMEEYSSHFQLQKPFIHEIGFYAGLPGIKPWEESEKVIPILLTEWRNVRKELEELFARRDCKRISAKMKQGICLILQFLFWTNKVPVQFPLDDVKHFKVKPMNFLDRLEFILSKPTLYHSFVQLNELMIEQEKHYAKLMLQNRRKDVKE
ncbi:YpoC family protein [Bacillus sp. B15-48]|uniref:YpoC family protein n=1 Tax=Bacillus sp. B15-48 TaxID=1548601 RepID=UPI00193FE638|nr:hypothetical protein [Bacillus sp. B15-48]MBM4762089.1 hypothetical protein [Bacillus sp. B15-48]